MIGEDDFLSRIKNHIRTDAFDFESYEYLSISSKYRYFVCVYTWRILIIIKGSNACTSVFVLIVFDVM